MISWMKASTFMVEVLYRGTPRDSQACRKHLILYGFTQEETEALGERSSMSYDQTSESLE